jgi:Uma2 family endonuclease
MNDSDLHRFTVEEYYRMEEIGVLDPDARVELLDGEIYDLSSISPFDAGVSIHLGQLFCLAAKGRWIVSLRNPVRLDKFCEPVPDLTLLKWVSHDYMLHHPTAVDVFLLIEIADLSIEHDRGRKLPIYARFDIAEVWIVNLPDRTIEVYREPHDADYGSKTILRFGDKISPAAFPDVVVGVESLFGT